jgi:hypothetical protein
MKRNFEMAMPPAIRHDQEQKYENPDQREPPVFRLPRLA